MNRLLVSRSGSKFTFSLTVAIAFASAATMTTSCTDSATESSGFSDTYPSMGEEVEVSKGNLERHVVTNGVLASPDSSPVIVERVRWYWDYNILWTEEEGKIVKKGDPVVKLDPSTIMKDLAEIEVNVEEARLGLEEEKIRAQDDLADRRGKVKKMEFNLKKKKLLVTDYDSVSEIEKQKQKLEVAAAKTELLRARNKVNLSIAKYKRKIAMKELRLKKKAEELVTMNEGLGKMTLVAPQDGLLIFPSYSTNSGWQKARPGAGIRTNTVVAEIANPKKLMVRAFVPEVDSQGIAVKIPGTATLDIYPGKEILGEVFSVSNVPTTRSERQGSKSNAPADNVRQFEVLFKLNKIPAGAMPGMTAKVDLIPEKKDNVMRIPIDALSTKPIGSLLKNKSLYERGDGAFVYVRSQKSSKYIWKKVKVGIRATSWIEVTDGLKVGDTVHRIRW